MKDVREDFSKQAKESNEQTFIWENKIDKIYFLSEKKYELAISYIDSLLKYDNSIDSFKITELQIIAGEILYDNNQIEKALERFDLSENSLVPSPSIKANKAGCLLKMEQFDKALKLLEDAAETNKSFNWHIGNFYEIKGEKEKAIQYYDKLFKIDTVYYKYCNDRINELKKTNYKLLKEIDYLDRENRLIITFH